MKKSLSDPSYGGCREEWIQLRKGSDETNAPTWKCSTHQEHTQSLSADLPPPPRPSASSQRAGKAPSPDSPQQTLSLQLLRQREMLCAQVLGGEHRCPEAGREQQARGQWALHSPDLWPSGPTLPGPDRARLPLAQLSGRCATLPAQTNTWKTLRPCSSFSLNSINNM